MTNKSNKLIAVHLLEILTEHSSEDNQLSQVQLLELLQTNYNEVVERHTLSCFLTLLKENGYINIAKNGQKSGVYLNRAN